jgi:hypothetical protein
VAGVGWAEGLWQSFDESTVGVPLRNVRPRRSPERGL